MPNPLYQYHSHMIFKVWEAYIIQKKLHFFVDIGRIQPALFTGSNNMLLPVHSCLLLKSDGSLYKTNKNETVSIIDEVNAVNHSAATGFSSAVDSLANAIQQVIVWNVSNAEQVTAHVFIFPYQVFSMHWNLGIIRTNFLKDKIQSASLHILEPLQNAGVLSETKKTQFKNVINTYMLSPIDFNIVVQCTSQQQDGSACGAITAENGKDFIDGTEARVKVRYESGASNLRQQHITDVNNPEFTRIQEDRVFVKPQSDGKGGTSTTLLTIDLLKSFGSIPEKFKEDIKNALINFSQNHIKICQGEIVAQPANLLKDLFQKNVVALKKAGKPVNPVLDKLYQALFKNDQFDWQDGAFDFLANHSGLMLRLLAEKKPSNPFSTGGGGENYEARVRAFFVVKLLSSDYVPVINWSNVEGIQLQARDRGYQTDDIVLDCNTGRGKQSLLIQVKHAIDFVPSNEAFSDSIIQFWLDFNNPNVFNHESDAFMLVFENDEQKSEAYKQLLTLARRTANLGEFTAKQTGKASSKQSEAKKSKVGRSPDIFQLIKEILQKIENNVPDAAIYNFIQKIYLLKLNLAPEGTDVAAVYSRIKEVTLLKDDKEIQQLWANVVKVASEFSEVAGTITYSNLPSDITQPFRTTVNPDLDNLDSWGSSQFPLLPDAYPGPMQQLQEATKRLQESPQLALFGMHGVGKTRLGLHIANNSRIFFPNTRCRLYFNAETHDGLVEQYSQLGKAARLPLDGYSTSTKSIPTKVTEWLGSKAGLFLFFDNAANKKSLTPFLPRTGSRILITTTSKSFAPASMEVKVLNETDAIELVKQELRDTIKNFDDAELKRFVNMLGYLPLALVHACAYIRYFDYTIAEYCTFYEDRKREALKDDTMKEVYDGKHASVYLTWDLSFKRIHEQNPEASIFLTQLAYLDVSHILLTFLSTLLSKDVAEIEGYIVLIVNLCLVSRTPERGITLHRILRDVILEKEREQGKSIGTLTKFLNTFAAMYIYRHNNTDIELAKLHAALPHIEMVLKHARKNEIDLSLHTNFLMDLSRYYLNERSNTIAAHEMLDMLEESPTASDEAKERVLYLRSRVKLRQNKFQDAEKLFNEYLETHPEDTLDVYELCHWANILVKQRPTTAYPRIDDVTSSSQIPVRQEKEKKVQKAELLLERAQGMAPNDSQELAMVLHYYGNYFLMSRQNPHRAFEYYSQSLKIRQGLLPLNEREIARTRHLLGLCHNRFGDIGKALIEFRAAYDVRKKYLFADETLASLKMIVKLLGKSQLSNNECLTNKERDAILNELLSTLYIMKKIMKDVNLKREKICYLIALTCLSLGRKDEANQNLDEIKEINTSSALLKFSSSELTSLQRLIGDNFEKIKNIKPQDSRYKSVSFTIKEVIEIKQKLNEIKDETKIDEAKKLSAKLVLKSLPAAVRELKATAQTADIKPYLTKLKSEIISLSDDEDDVANEDAAEDEEVEADEEDAANGDDLNDGVASTANAAPMLM